MCHSSCLTCVDELFTSCTSCSGVNTLYNGVCYCSSAWSSDCASELMFEDVFKFGDSILRVCFVFIVVMYCLKVKLPISYRLVSGMQGLALLIYSSNMYLDYEDFFLLKTFNFLSGPYQLQYRLQNLSNQHAKQVYYLLAFFFVLFMIFYYPTKTFIPQSQLGQKSSYFTYLKNCSFSFLENFYYFGSKFMWYFIGMFIVQNDNSISVIISMCIFSLICLISMGKVFYDYHYDKIDQSVFTSSLYIYCMMSNSIFIGLPLISVGQSNMLLLIYCLPIGVLLLVFLLNKQTKIIQKNTIKFIIVQVLMVVISIVFILLNNMIQSIILLALIFLSLLVILIQSSILYYGGFSFNNSSKKIMPFNENNNQNAQNTEQEINQNENVNININRNRNDHFF